MPIGSQRMSKLYLGKGKTRPIPRITYTDDVREQSRSAIQHRTRPAGQIGNRNAVNAPQVSGSRVRRGVGGAGFSPSQSNAKAI